MSSQPHWIIGTFLPGSDISEPPFTIEYYRQSYFELAQEVALLGGTLVIVRDNTTYLGNGVFSRAWRMSAPGVFEELGRTKVDAVFDKSNFANDGKVAQFNHPAVTLLCTDKLLMYEHFAEFCPKTMLATTPDEYHSALSAIGSKMVVCKPQFGSEGQSVVIDSPTVLAKLEPEFPVILQEFIDTSEGIEGIVAGHHDLRVAIFDGEILYSYVRTPPPNKLTANVAQGGSFFMLEASRLPQSVVEISTHIDAQLARFGSRFYSIDFGMTPNGPKIIEMNARLGLLPNSDSPVFHTLKKKMAAAFKLIATTH